MEPSIVRKLLPELKVVSKMFGDVVFLCSGDAEEIETSCFRTNSLVVAALSPMLADALAASSTDESLVTVMLPCGITSKDLGVFFGSFFDWNFGQNLDIDDLESVKKVVDVLSISFNFNDVSSNVDLADATNLEDVAQIGFKCDVCDANFSSSKLLKRHSRTAHADDHPHVCNLCGRRCRGRSG